MTQRKTTLIQNHPPKWNCPNNYRPIRCLPMMWKILTTQIRDDIYFSPVSRELFPGEQKRCRKGTRGTANWFTYPHEEQEETKKCCYSLVWPQNGIRYRLAKMYNRFKMYKISDKVINLIEETMKNSKEKFTGERKCLYEVKTREIYFRVMHYHHYYL